MLIYSAALKEMTTKLEILNEEFQHVHRYNPIEHIKSRIKTPQSIVRKLRRHGYDSTISNMVKYCNDIAGVRVICDYTSDIYKIADMISNQNDIRVVAIKDYIEHPNLEHKIQYKFPGVVPQQIQDELLENAKKVSELDASMQKLNEEIREIAGEDEEMENK